MKIIVLITPVHDCLHPIVIESGGKRVASSCIRWIINPYDAFALEEALQIKDDIPGTKVDIIGIAPPQGEATFRECLAVGADGAIRIWDDGLEDSDSYVRASVLAAVLLKQPFDLLLSGWKSSDIEHGQLRPILAELLSVPLITSARKIIPGSDSGRIVALKRIPGHLLRLSSPLPSIVTFEKGRQLRYPKYPDRRKANKMPISVLDFMDIRQSEAGIAELIPLTVVERLTLPKPSKRSALAASEGSISAFDKLKQIMTGGFQDQKENKKWECRDPQSISKVVDHIIKEKIIIL